MRTGKRRGRTVLCIGNEPVSLNLRCALLQNHGWTVLSSGHGHDGILRFDKEFVDVVVVDLNHEGAESALITGELKRLRPEVPVIIVVTDGACLADGATHQASAVILKSEEANALISALNTVLPPE